MPETDQFLVQDLDEILYSLAAVRRGVGTVLAGLGRVDLCDVLLVVSELVTNAYQHGQHPRRLTLALVGRRVVRLEVADASYRVPILGRPDRPASGRGLLLVNGVASVWGVRQHEPGKIVWAEVSY